MYSSPEAFVSLRSSETVGARSPKLVTFTLLSQTTTYYWEHSL